MKSPPPAEKVIKTDTTAVTDLETSGLHTQINERESKNI